MRGERAPASPEPDEFSAATANGGGGGWGAGWGRERSIWETRREADAGMPGVPAAAAEDWAGHDEDGAWAEGDGGHWEDEHAESWEGPGAITWDSGDAGSWQPAPAASWEAQEPAPGWDRGDGWHQTPGQWGEQEAPEWAASARPESGWAAGAAHHEQWTGDAWPREADIEAEPVWGQPIDSSYQAGWAADPTAEPAWEWPGRPDAQADGGPAAAWFGDGAPGADPQQGWASEAWHRGPAPGQPAAWPPPPTGAPDQGNWAPQQPTTWSGWEEEQAEAAPARDPWAGIEPVDGDWAGADDDARTDERSPSRLTFHVGDDARAPKGDQQPGQKPKKTLLGRLKG